MNRQSMQQFLQATKKIPDKAGGNSMDPPTKKRKSYASDRSKVVRSSQKFKKQLKSVETLEADQNKRDRVTRRLKEPIQDAEETAENHFEEFAGDLRVMYEYLKKQLDTGKWNPVTDRERKIRQDAIEQLRKDSRDLQQKAFMLEALIGPKPTLDTTYATRATETRHDIIASADSDPFTLLSTQDMRLNYLVNDKLIDPYYYIDIED